MTIAWSHLPNAQHIDRILADVKVNPYKWDAAWTRARTAAWDATRTAAWDATRDATRDAALDAAYTAAYTAALDAARKAARDAAWDAALDAAWTAAINAAGTAILALIAWDETSDYLDLPVEQVRVLAALGNHKAVLILPAAIAFDQQKEIT